MNNLNFASQIHKKIFNFADDIIKPPIKLIDIEQQIFHFGKKLFSKLKNNNIQFLDFAFPIGLNKNNIVAHFSPYNNDEDILTENDVLKVDIGICLNGYIIDSAKTYYFKPEFEPLISATKDAIVQFYKNAGVDKNLGDLGEIIQETIESYEVQLNNNIYPLYSIKDVCGHNILLYTVHGGIAIPNIKINYNKKLEEGMIYAIEPYATTGNGKTIENFNHISHISMKQYEFDYNIFKERNFLPFHPKWFNNINTNNFKEYPVIEDKIGTFSAQTEETFIIENEKIIFLSKTNNLIF
jgi:methionyl aminopeptidase